MMHDPIIKPASLSAQTIRSDRAAIALNLFCLAHCLALPILALTMPIAGTLAEFELIHQVLAGLTIVISLSVPLRAKDARNAAFLLPACTGIALILAGIFPESLGFGETLPTVAGALLVSFAHILRLVRR